MRIMVAQMRIGHCLVLLLALGLLTATDSVCGDPGEAEFNTNKRPQGYRLNEDGMPLYGELMVAISCYVSGLRCQHPSLPSAARGSDGSDATNLKLFYGSNITNWCTGRVINFSYMTTLVADVFNEPLLWNTSQGRKFESAFAGNPFNTYNQPLAHWDLSNARNLYLMFYQNDRFDQDISSWQISKVNNFGYTFFGASSFTSNISNWDVGNGLNFGNCFQNAALFNVDLSSWNVANACRLNNMFDRASSFNQDLNSWGEQLAGKTCGNTIPTLFRMFTKSACEVTTRPKPGSFCQRTYENCLAFQYTQLQCDCLMRKQCVDGLVNSTDCQAKFVEDGNDASNYKSDVKAFVDGKCAS